MLSCAQFRGQLAAELDGELTPAIADAWQAHADACPVCSAAWDNSRRVNAQIQSWLGASDLFAMPAEASDRLHRVLHERLGPASLAEAHSQPSPPPAHRWRPFWNRRLWSYRPAWAALAILVLVAVGVFRWNAGASTVSGWLIDRHCYAAFRTHAQDHPRDCLLRCAPRGYGLVDAHGRFLPFNPKGNRSARAAIAATHKLNHLWVTVLATQSSNNVLDVEHLALTAPPEAPPN